MISATDLSWDKQLHIVTTGDDFSKLDSNNYAYQPTPYYALEFLAKSHWLTKDDTVVDIGCGMGRVNFFLTNQIGCKSIGIDHDQSKRDIANKNISLYYNHYPTDRTKEFTFISTKAEDFMPDRENCFYFFNPFSTEILQKVLDNIKQSKEKSPREIHAVFYYITNEYRDFFSQNNDLILLDEIHFSNLPVWSSEYKYVLFSIK